MSLLQQKESLSGAINSKFIGTDNFLKQSVHKTMKLIRLKLMFKPEKETTDFSSEEQVNLMEKEPLSLRLDFGQERRTTL